MELAQDCAQWWSSVLAMLKILFLLPESVVALCLRFLSQVSKMLFPLTGKAYLLSCWDFTLHGP
jgi:hypothetical protein